MTNVVKARELAPEAAAGRARPVVLKFGGTSVGDPAARRTAVGLVLERAVEGPVAVVVSALSGVTDALAWAARRAATGALELGALRAELLGRHLDALPADLDEASRREVLVHLGRRLEALEVALNAIREAGRPSPRLLDAVLVVGERLSLPVFGAHVAARGAKVALLDGADLVRTDDRFGDANADLAVTRGLVAAAWRSLEPGAVPIVSGFVGATVDGTPTTLGRGGSDTTAAVLGHALDAVRVEIWTDADGVATADPRLSPVARTLAHLSYDEAERLARAGAKVLHDKTVAPLRSAQIPLLVRNTFRPDGAGTRVGSGVRRRPGEVLAVTSHADGGRARIEVHVASHGVDDLAARAAEALSDAGVRAEPALPARDPRALAFRVAAEDRERAVRALDEAVVTAPPHLDLVVAGARGRVGRALLASLGELGARTGVELRVVGAFQRDRAVFDARGLSGDAVVGALAAAAHVPWRRALARVRDAVAAPVVLVDVTASADVARAYLGLVEAGIGIATANKHALVLPAAEDRALRARVAEAGLLFAYATTVGAGLPILRTARELARGGDRLAGVAAVLSGTLAYVFDRVNRGEAFSVAVAQAHRLGWTEPDPRDDLAGLDVARKLLIVLREAGLDLSLGDVTVESLVPDGARAAATVDGALASLAEADERWLGRAAAARARGERLAYVAEFDGARARVGVRALPVADPLVRGLPGENVVAFRTDRYDTVPLSISGPGAGPELTAGNLLSELVRFARPTPKEAPSPYPSAG